MLEFAESVLSAVRKLQRETQEHVIAGKIRDMEQYRFLMGRLEAYGFVEAEIKDLLSRNKELV